MSALPLHSQLGDVDANGDIITELELVGPGTSLLELASPLGVNATAPGPEHRVHAERQSTSKLQSIVRRARETSGHQRLRWTLRERRAFDELVERGESC